MKKNEATMNIIRIHCEFIPKLLIKSTPFLEHESKFIILHVYTMTEFLPSILETINSKCLHIWLIINYVKVY